MNINSLLKKEGIENIQKIKPKEINAIARDIAIKLCLAFPEQNLNRQTLFENISNINMYRASMNNDSSGAKYVADANSIFFNKDLGFEDLPEIAMHECIHFIQSDNSKKQIGLYDYYSGLALNEAAVQLMASTANMCNTTYEKLYGINLKTNSPKYYPLQCAIVNQMAFFTGYYPLYASTLNSNDIFKKTFISRFNKRVYKEISKNLDKLLYMENDLHYYVSELSLANKNRDIKSLNDIIAAQKNDISKLFFKIQNYIIKNCFGIEFANITNHNMLYDFKKQLYEFKNVIGFTDNYTFYNDFYCDMMNAIQIKKKQITNASNNEIEPCALVIVDKQKPSIVFLNNAIKKLKKIIGLKVVSED